MNLAVRLRRSLQTSALAWHIARRYLFSRERQALEWVVTLISIAGVAVGVSTIITTFGVVDGMESHVIGQITSNVPSLTIHHPDWRREDPDPALLKKLRAQPGVLLAEPILSQGALAMIERAQSQFMMVYATERLGEVNLFNVLVPKGGELRPAPGKLLVSSSLTSRSLAGRQVTLLAQRPGRSVLPVPQTLSMEVQDNFKLGNRYFGRFIAFASWADVRALTQKKKGVDSVFVRLADPMRADAAKERLLKVLPAGATITTWADDFEQMFSDMKTINAGMFLVVFMTMVVAALNIIGTLTLIVIQKTREIGILKAMGARRQLIGRIFLAEGALIGAVGAVAGILLALALCGLVKFYKIPMPGHFLNVREIPVQLRPVVMTLTAVLAIVISTLAALAPAWRAGGLKPVEALRHE